MRSVKTIPEEEKLKDPTDSQMSRSMIFRFNFKIIPWLLQRMHIDFPKSFIFSEHPEIKYVLAL